MNSLITCALEVFICDAHGPHVWAQILRQADVHVEHFEPLSSYDTEVLEKVSQAAVTVLNRPYDVIYEDLGSWLVLSAKTHRLRRLLRFGGTTYLDFLHSLEELPARAHLALPELKLPELYLTEIEEGEFRLAISSKDGAPFHHYRAVLTGLLRAMADDYGALVFLDLTVLENGHEEVSIKLLDVTYSEGRHFDLAQK